MKKSVTLLFLLMLSVTSLVFASTACDLSISLINQDPYPAVQGDYVKLVFQLDGVSSSECGEVTVELLDEYPLVFDASSSNTYTIKAGTYSDKDYQSYFMIPFKARVAEGAVDGDNPVEVRVSNNLAVRTETFNMDVEDVRADFEVFVKDYDYTTKEVTLGIINVGAHNIEAVTLEIPEQNSIEVKGSNLNVVGDLDSNEDTTTTFEATFFEDAPVKVILAYSDSNNERRTSEETINFNSKYFVNRAVDNQGGTNWGIVFWIVVALVVVFIAFKKLRKKKS